ncbi:MAG: DUF1295 domain-containing protein [Rhodanobacteraceae bacterium]
MNLQPLLFILGLSSAVMLCGLLAQRRMRNLALADMLWAGCISAASLYYGLIAGGAMLPRLLVAMMGGVWGFRLFMHLLQRMLAEPPDSRYRDLFGRVGSNPLRLLGFFLAKGVSATLFSVPLYVAASNPHDQATLWIWLAAAVYIVGLSGESYADIQLAKFRDQPRNAGRTCRRGLWRYSRHPNYFFALVHWTSYALLAVGVSGPQWSLTLLAALLTAVGAMRRIPAIEAQALKMRGDDYRDYQRTTNMFVPWLPKGWPHDAAATNAWYTPPPAARAAPSPTTRATPIPGARITPNPATRETGSISGPTTPEPRRGRAPTTPDAHSRIAVDEFDD